MAKTPVSRKKAARRYRKSNMMRRFYSIVPKTYTAQENCVLSALTITLPAGGNTASGVFSISMNALPQVTDYASLFRQFCIRSVKYTIVPRYGQTETNAQFYNQSLPITHTGNFRFLYCVNDTPFVSAAPSEADMLQNNNTRITYLNDKIFAIRQAKPKPETTVTIGTGGTQVNMSLTGKDQWFNFTGGQTSNGGQNVNHGNVQYYVTGAGSFPNGAIIADVYASVIFSCRNPD